MKKTNLLLILSALISMNAMAFVKGSYTCEGSDSAGQKIEVEFVASPYIGLSCTSNAPDSGVSCDHVSVLGGMAKFSHADDTLKIQGLDFEGDVNDPHHLIYGNGKLMRRKRIELHLYENQTNPSLISFTLRSPYAPFLEGTLNCVKR